MLDIDLAWQRQRAFARRSPNERAVRANAIDIVVRERVAESAVGVGDPAPLFVLHDRVVGDVSLGALLTSGPVVVCFFRGSWCPYCNLELRAYQAKLAQIRQLGATVVAISPELPHRCAATEQSNHLDYPVVSDPGNAVARRYRLTHTIEPEVVRYQLRHGTNVAAFNGSGHAEVPLPATYVVGTDGIVEFAFVDADYTHRAEPGRVLTVLRDVVMTDARALAGARW